jgi:hypothetical protein
VAARREAGGSVAPAGAADSRRGHVPLYARLETPLIHALSSRADGEKVASCRGQDCNAIATHSSSWLEINNACRAIEVDDTCRATASDIVAITNTCFTAEIRSDRRRHRLGETEYSKFSQFAPAPAAGYRA